MSRFDAAFAASGLPGLMHQLGQSAICTMVDGPGVTLSGLKSPEVTRVDEVGGVRQDVRTCELTIGLDPAASNGGVAEPERIATVTISSEEWSVENVKGRTGAYAILELMSTGLTEIARGGFREPMR